MRSARKNLLMKFFASIWQIFFSFTKLQILISNLIEDIISAFLSVTMQFLVSVYCLKICPV